LEPRDSIRGAYDLLAQDYSRLRSRGFDETSRLVSGKEFQFICDAGSGPGTYGGLLARSYSKVIHLDLSPEMVEVGWHRAFADGIAWKVNYLVCDVSCLPLKDDSMDLTASIAVIHHLPKDLAKRALRELFRVTSRLGTLFLSVWLPAAMDKAEGSSPSEDERTVWWKKGVTNVGRRYWKWDPGELKGACFSSGMAYLDAFVSGKNIFVMALKI